MNLGIDVLLSSAELLEELKGKRVCLVAHPASVTKNLEASISSLLAKKVNVVSAFGPQHGMRGEKQDNMIETDDYVDPLFQIPVYSLYGKSRRPTAKAMATFDILLFDLQDVGTRIYTFLTTLRYLLESCHEHQKEIWILDRPNPAGRPVEGLLLRDGWESFVGAGPLPMRHGLTLGECGLYLQSLLKLNRARLRVIAMENYHVKGEDFGWPRSLSWVNPSPNAAGPEMAKIFPGSVMVEGTTFSEGRGTTKALEIVGAPDLDMAEILKSMSQLAPEWMLGCKIRACYFEPTFHKHQHQMCSGFQVHVDGPFYDPVLFKPYRLFALFFKAVRAQAPSYEIWRHFAYEYETDRLAIDLINGSSLLREWVDDASASVADFENLTRKDEELWLKTREEFCLY